MSYQHECIMHLLLDLETGNRIIPVGLVYFLYLGLEGGSPLCFSGRIRVAY